jgi:predicted AAA+ superfamily ATPase
MYKKRLVDNLLKEYIEDFPAILIEGAKAVGKTSSCLELANSDFRLDDTDTNELVSASMDSIIKRERPVLIDEWQRLPAIWDYIRRCVDNNLPNGALLLTGSSPKLYSNIHSGSGRIVRLKMRPYSIEEREMAPVKVRLSNFLSGSINQLLDEETDVALADYVDEIFRSGYPGIRDRSERAIERAVKSYIDNITTHDFKENNILIRKPQSLKLWLQTYAAASATTTAHKTITQTAMSQDTQSPTEKTASNYRELLSGMGIVEELQAWLPMGKLFPVLGKTPKHFLVDPALIPSLLSFDKQIVMNGQAKSPIGKLNKSFIGQLFESLVYQSIATYAEINEADLSHLRLSNGTHEIDFIVQKKRTIVAIEVKSASSINAEDVKHLIWLHEQIKEEFTVHKVIIYMGKHTYVRKDGVFVIPAAVFGA